ncbi:hypothetical protein ACQP1P_28735 [Dactylosporangium sp. CA-052675]|uniref:hypothetical protein n=1 Tax=Dactylosporangium sp. CA-052675 TaxID=3239927 RepID=UPI003D8A6238
MTERTVIGYLGAAVVAVCLSELMFEPQDTAYWRLWLGRLRYYARRLTLSAVPVLAGLLAAWPVVSGTTAVEQVGRGMLAGVAAAALLRARVGRTHLRPGPLRERDSVDGSARIDSALSWVYERMCRRMDAEAARRIHGELKRLKQDPSGHAALLASAEELAVVLGRESRNGSRKALKDSALVCLTDLRRGMDVVADELATPQQRQVAAYEVAEILTVEFERRRWDRHTSIDQGKGSK